MQTTLTAILKRMGAGILPALLLASCSIMDYEGDCSVNYRARFRYDMHLHYSDAFAHEVQSVALYAFDRDGKFVQQFTESGEALQQEGYSLPFELPLVRAGERTAVARRAKPYARHVYRRRTDLHHPPGL